MKTKISLVLLGLGLVCASAAYAGHAEETPMPVSNDINVTAPDQAGSWSFGGTAVFLQPLTQSFDYATIETVDAVSANQTDITNVYTVDPDYRWWFGADITYHFPGNGRDVTLAYEGLHGSTSDSVSNADGILVSAFPSQLNGGVGVTGYTGAEGTVKTAYDAGDLLFGQKLDVGSRVSLHPFAGLRYAHVNVKSEGEYSNGTSFIDNGNGRFDVLPGFFEEGTIDSTYDGIGPRFGSDAQVNLGNGFSIRGRVGLSALIGSISVDNDDLIVNPDNFPGQSLYTAVKTESETRVVPEIDGRLGVNYTYNFDSGMALGLELGWEAMNYFNAVNNDPTDVTAESDFAVQGPYARVQFDIA